MSASEPPEGLKLIQHNIAGVDELDDPSYPYKLEVNLRSPELMQVAFVMLHGGSEVMVVRGMTREAIEQFIEQNNLRRHPRLRRMILSDSSGATEEFTR